MVVMGVDLGRERGGIPLGRCNRAAQENKRQDY